MLIVLSPSKTLDYDSPVKCKEFTQPALLAQSEILIKDLRKYTPAKLSKLMDISDKLATLNTQRYHDFHTPFTPENARQALLAFKGDVYEGIRVEDYAKADFAYAQKHVRVLSGLYGLLRPLDLMQPYRLEMGTGLKTARGKNLYQFWGRRITDALNDGLQEAKSKLLINLASEEYFKAVDPNALKGDILTIQFKERRGNKLQIIGLFAKKARGLMADYAIRNRVKVPEELQKFTENGYRFDPELSGPANWVFVH